jgi:hypothetical protein
LTDHCYLHNNQLDRNPFPNFMHQIETRLHAEKTGFTSSFRANQRTDLSGKLVMQ